MKIHVMFDKVKPETPTPEGVGFADELKPLLDAYAWKPKKGEAVLDFLSELAEANRECEVTCDEKGVACMAVAGCGRRLLLVANLRNESIPFKIDAGSYRPLAVRLIDNTRTKVGVPMLAALPPLSILLIAFKGGEATDAVK